ncbi:hypothetical protein AHF37_02163 [Paragonimus kellicotti]|nr:hypothetical protein AHF37_02163 [Paragonimus kellicotti]
MSCLKTVNIEGASYTWVLIFKLVLSMCDHTLGALIGRRTESTDGKCRYLPVRLIIPCITQTPFPLSASIFMNLEAHTTVLDQYEITH